MTHRRIRRYIQANKNFQDIDVRTILNNAIRGKLNVVGEFSLVKDATRTTISDDLITTISYIDWTPKSAAAASHGTTIFYSATEEHRVILQHASTSTSTLLYDFIVLN